MNLSQRLRPALAVAALAGATAGCAAMDPPHGPLVTVNSGVPVTGTDIAATAEIRTDAFLADPATVGCTDQVVVMNGAAVPRGPLCPPGVRP